MLTCISIWFLWHYVIRIHNMNKHACSKKYYPPLPFSGFSLLRWRFITLYRLLHCKLKTQKPSIKFAVLYLVLTPGADPGISKQGKCAVEGAFYIYIKVYICVLCSKNLTFFFNRWGAHLVCRPRFSHIFSAWINSNVCIINRTVFSN